MGHSFLFIGGLHRSGTTPLYHLLGSDPRISIFRDTGVGKDEGQFLQTVYPVDSVHGGVGHFGLDPAAHLTESSHYVETARRRLLKEWKSHWDLRRPVLAEKSPANLIRSRFLQAVFPDALFIFIIRHPIAACMATSKWTGAYMTTLLKNWVACHEFLAADLPYLKRAMVLKYEDFTKAPKQFLMNFSELLDFEPEFDWGIIKPGLNYKYYDRWRKGDFLLKGPKWKDILKKWRNKFEIYDIEKNYEKRISKFGYSFKSLI